MKSIIYSVVALGCFTLQAANGSEKELAKLLASSVKSCGSQVSVATVKVDENTVLIVVGFSCGKKVEVYRYRNGSLSKIW